VPLGFAAFVGSAPEDGMEPALVPGRSLHMLSWALTFFLVALVAGLLGFTGIAIGAAAIAKVLFFIFLVLFLLSLVAHISRRI
jgi:uncharacterized membrane protein YtjA (UPF0391 family)